MSDNLENQTASLASVIQQGINNKLLDVHTSMPGIIVSFDEDTQLCSVQPAIRRIFKSVNSEDKETLIPTDLPILINVLVEFPSGGGFCLTFPVTEGDECIIDFSERSIDNWNKNGGISDPSAFRQHSLSDASVRVGPKSQPNVITNFSSTDTELRNSDRTQRITLKANGDIEIETTSNISFKAPAITLDGAVNITGLLTAESDIDVTGTLAATVEVTAGAVPVGLTTHVHAQAVDSAGDTQVPTVEGLG